LRPALALGEAVKAIGESADQLAQIAAEPGKDLRRFFLAAPNGGNESVGEVLCREPYDRKQVGVVFIEIEGVSRGQPGSPAATAFG
jgi:proline racemase